MIIPNTEVTNVEAVASFFQGRDLLNKLLKESLQQAQQRYKHYADLHITEREFEIGDWVYLWLQPYKQSSVALRKNLKLSSKYFGPYQVIEKTGKVAYKLSLSQSSLVHPVFHVSLKKENWH